MIFFNIEAFGVILTHGPCLSLALLFFCLIFGLGHIFELLVDKVALRLLNVNVHLFTVREYFVSTIDGPLNNHHV